MFRVLFFNCLFIWFHANAQDTLKTHIILDPIGNEVFLIVDNKQRPKKYFSSVFTPVCADGSCYPINIELHWDLAGNYLKYTLDKNEILTKIEHLPFTDFDYGLLHRMIRKSPSALAKFSIYELTLPGKDKVDGVTGATRPELSGNFVPDALFTTYTLWHLARKPKKDLLDFTKGKYFTEEWTSFIMRNGVLECRKEFINNLLIGKNQAEQAELLFALINEYSSSFPLEFIQGIDENELTKIQFVKLYQETDNNKLKLAVIDRWKGFGIDEVELIVLTNEIGFCSSCFNEELVLIKQFQNWPENEYELFYSKIQNQSNMIRREKMSRILEERVDSYPKKFKKVINRTINF